MRSDCQIVTYYVRGIRCFVLHSLGSLLRYTKDRAIRSYGADSKRETAGLLFWKQIFGTEARLLVQHTAVWSWVNQQPRIGIEPRNF
jgi:hypothetical protein